MNTCSYIHYYRPKRRFVKCRCIVGSHKVWDWERKVWY